MNIFLFFLPLTIIYGLNQNFIKITNKEAKEFTLGEKVDFNLYDNNYFQLDYNPDQDENITVFITFENGIDLLNLKDPDDNTEIIECKYYYETYIIEFNLTIKGKYYFEFISDSNTFDNSFTTFVPGKIINTINLEENVYFSKIKIETLSENQMYSMYKVKNLNEDKYVFFGYEKSFYFDENYTSPFTICRDNSGECMTNVNLYKFSKNNEYTIYINFVNVYNTSYYFYFPFLFFPISQNSIKKKEKGYYTSLEPIIYYFNIENNQNLYSYFSDCQNVFISLSNEEITLNNLGNLDLKEISESEASFNSSNYVIIVAIPKINSLNSIATKVAVADDIIYNVKEGAINIPKGKTKIIYLKNNNNEENTVNLYNTLTTYSSTEKNMRFISDAKENKKYDFLIQNNEYYPIYIEKSENDISINIKILNSKYSFFTAINQELFKMYLLNYIKSTLNIDITDFKQIFPLNLRINSNLNTFYDFVNLYFYNFEDNITLYINEIYGSKSLYECDEDLIKNKDLSILKKPILKCKNQQLALDRLLSFKDIKLLFFYLGYNSLFDIYLDDDNDNNKIQISSLSRGINNCTAKYLKKDVEYTIDFTLDHLVKMKPKLGAKVTIYNNKDEPISLTSSYPTREISGNNYNIKANEDVMVYLYGKLFKHIKQIEIKNEKDIIKIKTNKKVNFVIDAGFKGYNPLNIELFLNPHITENTVIYLENIYKLLLNNLVQNEKIYLYYTSKENIEDVDINIYYINNNNNLIIDNRYIEYITYSVNFCTAPQLIKFYYEGQANYQQLFEFNDSKKNFTTLLDKYGTRITIDSREAFVLFYSFKDYTDQIYEKNRKWLEERKVLNDLTIEEMSLSNSEHKILLKFYPNYKNSVTQYAIIIAPENNNNTLSNFNNPCYLTTLLNQMPKGVKIEFIMDIGENDLINAEIDISEISTTENIYIVNIMSTELRFEKKLNIYKPISNNKNNKTVNNAIIIILFIILSIILLILIIILCRHLNRGKSQQKIEKYIQNETLMLDCSDEN